MVKLTKEDLIKKLDRFGTCGRQFDDPKRVAYRAACPCDSWKDFNCPTGKRLAASSFRILEHTEKGEPK